MVRGCAAETWSSLGLEGEPQARRAPLLGSAGLRGARRGGSQVAWLHGTHTLSLPLHRTARYMPYGRGRHPLKPYQGLASRSPPQQFVRLQETSPTCRGPGALGQQLPPPPFTSPLPGASCGRPSLSVLHRSSPPTSQTRVSKPEASPPTTAPKRRGQAEAVCNPCPCTYTEVHNATDSSP